MAKFIVRPTDKIEGEIVVDGAKNGVLPVMAAALLTDGICQIENVPNLKDVSVMVEVISALGAEVKRSGDKMIIETPKITNNEAPYEFVSKMRSSFDVMGPLLARTGLARVPMPGGCAIGERPIDLHLKGFRALGAEISFSRGAIEAKADKLIGNSVYLDYPSVGATKNIMMAATLAEGTTYIDNAAKEPEIIDLANFINKMGGKISGAGTDTVKIVGVEKMATATHSVLPDRIEAATYLVMAGLVKSDVTIKAVEPSHVRAVVAKLRECGVEIGEGNDYIRVQGNGELGATNITTLPHPGFPTDVQAQFMVLLTKANGSSVVMETLFENRFMHVSELNRMGANIKIEGHSAIINGPICLQGAHVKATDLRAGAALILAGLIAEGETHIHDIEHIDRGYNKIENKLSELGISITRIVD